MVTNKALTSSSDNIYALIYLFFSDLYISVDEVLLLCYMIMYSSGLIHFYNAVDYVTLVGFVLLIALSLADLLNPTEFLTTGCFIP